MRPVQNTKDLISALHKLKHMRWIYAVAGGAAAALVALAIWDLLSSGEKEAIKKTFRIHHGEIGAILSAFGLLFLLSNKKKGTQTGAFLLSFGATLMVDDFRDADKWFSEIRC